MPDKKRFQLSLEGIKEAAVALKEVGQPIFKVAMEVSRVLGV